MSGSSAASRLTALDLIGEITHVVSSATGIQLGDRQRAMVENRLKKRILDLGLHDEAAYAEHFRKNRDSETQALISLLTTHHTFFFREYFHFEALEKQILPACIASAKANGRKTIRIWSAACSRGQEVYSLSMFMALHLPRLAPGFTYEILGTDVDSESVKIAKNGVYHRREIKEAPLSLLGNHWARGTGEISDFVKAKASIKGACKFEVGNLISMSPLSAAPAFDIIFCRNVFIYFNSEQIQTITRGLLSRLTPEGFLVVGISESLNGLNLPVVIDGPSIYSKTKARPKEIATAPVPAQAATPQDRPAPLRILCVDDSPSVLALLKKVLVKEQGFEVVATAQNGLEAAKALKLHTVDAMTLDIHMPEQTGLEYLAKNFGPSHPPVVMITSVSRESSDLALQCLKNGASDFIEKPALSNLAERGDEIRTKLICAVQSRSTAGARDLTLDTAFKSKPVIRNPDAGFRAIIASYSAWEKLAGFFKAVSGAQPPSVVFVEGAEALLSEYAKVLSGRTRAKVEVVTSGFADFKAGGIYLADFGAAFDPILSGVKGRKKSILVYGGVSSHGAKKLLLIPGAQLLVEDPGKAVKAQQKELLSRATDVVPETSFAYMSIQFLSDGNGK